MVEILINMLYNIFVDYNQFQDAEELIMKSLYDLINEELVWLAKNKYTKYDNLDLFITDDKKSADFINSLTESFEYETPDNDSQLYQIAIGRARHSAITFLTGLVFKKFLGIYDDINNILGQPDTAFKLWLMTSLNHDRGYTSAYITQGELDYNKKFKYYLLSRNYADIPLLDEYDNKYPNSLAYTYQEINGYDRYARLYHKNDSDGRRLDHGILGGMLLFNTLINKHIKSPQNSIDPLIIKTSSLAIAQHNIFKSSGEKSDKKYIDHGLARLVSTSNFVIEQNCALLLLLSLVDTIECVKNYSKKENEKNSMHTTTVLKNIMVDVFENEIVIDYSKLSEKEITTRGNNDICKSVVKNIIDLKKWTCFNVDNQKYTITVSLHIESREVDTKISA